MMMMMMLMLMMKQVEEEELTRINRRQNRRIILVWLDNDTRRMARSKDPRPLYFGNEEIVGHLSIEIQGGRPVRQVKVMLTNLVQIRWCNQPQTRRPSNVMSSVPEKRRKSIFADYFSSPIIDEKQLFFYRHKVIELDLLSPERKLTDGKHEIPFRFHLPKSDLPSSMKSCHGLIKYTIEAFTIDDDHKGHESRGEKEILLLVPNLDLRQVERKITQTFITNDGNSIDISVMLDRKIYQPGEMLSFSLSIRNESDSPMECLVAMYQRQTLINSENSDQVKEHIYDKCLNDSPNRDDNDEMSQAVMIPIDANSQVQDEPIQMRLPYNLVLSLDSALITIRYYVLITINNIPDNNDQSMEVPFLVSLTNNHYGQRIDPTQQRMGANNPILQRQISR
nr:arrestin domain-containing protein 3-like [Dermatophagoides farinae]XP_046913988.1 arrestin domain-containing protein 3-like [Dermatophagoides farinae]